jgi:hypothetical protein
MIKFTVNKQNGVRKAFDENEKCIALFGTASDLRKVDILNAFPCNCEQHIVCIEARNCRITEHATVETAKEYIRYIYNV